MNYSRERIMGPPVKVTVGECDPRLKKLVSKKESSAEVKGNGSKGRKKSTS